VTRRWRSGGSSTEKDPTEFERTDWMDGGYAEMKRDQVNAGIVVDRSAPEVGESVVADREERATDDVRNGRGATWMER